MTTAEHDAAPDPPRRGAAQPWQPLLRALQPLIEACGATLVDPDGGVLLGSGERGARQAPLMWEGRLVGIVHLPDLHSALDRLVADVERQLGGPLRALSREDKQRAVQLLDERGAFTLRKAVEDVADELGVSRFTVYNYIGRRQGRD
jgi:hypothetical protein